MRACRVVGSLILVLVAGAARAASFDCTKTSTPVEKLVCGNETLSGYDEYLGRYYASARAEVGSAASCLGANQRNWLRTVRNACTDASCLQRVYLERLAELDPLQPGATALRNVELPRVKALAWVIPPADDQVAAPRDPKRPLLILTGRILDETANGDGFVLQDARGDKHPLLMLMFILKSSGVRLETLAHEPGSSFEVTGQEERSGDTRYFSPGACIFIRRLPK